MIVLEEAQKKRKKLDGLDLDEQDDGFLFNSGREQIERRAARGSSHPT